MLLTTLVGTSIGLLVGASVSPLILRAERLTKPALASVVVIAIAAATSSAVDPPVRRLAVLALVSLTMALVRIRPDLSRLRIEARIALRLLAATFLWQAGISINPSGRTSIDFVATVTLFTVAVTAFDLRKEPDDADLLNGLFASLAFLLLATLGGQFLVAPTAALVAGLFGGLAMRVRRFGTIDIPGIGAFLGTWLAALAMLTGDAVATEGIWRTEVVIATGVLILGPSVLAATIVLTDRMRNGLSPLAERDDRLLDRLAPTEKARRRIIVAAVLMNLIHSMAAIALGRTSGSLVLPVVTAITFLDTAVLWYSLRALSHSKVEGIADHDVTGGADRPSHGLQLTAPEVAVELLRPGTWIRRSRLVWAHRDATVPMHLRRTRIRPLAEGGDLLKGLWLTLLSWTVRRRMRIAPRADELPDGSVDIVVAAKDGDRVLYMDSQGGVVIHRHSELRLLPRELAAHERTFEHLRGARILQSFDGETIIQQLLDGRHLHDVDDTVKVGALASLLLDAISLTAITSEPASERFIMLSSSRYPDVAPLLESLRTVVAPATQSLDNVMLTGAQEIAWIETLPIVECSFHLPWFGVATRLATVSHGVDAALRSGAFDTGMRALLRFGGVAQSPTGSLWDLYQTLPWTRLAIGEGQDSGR